MHFINAVAFKEKAKGKLVYLGIKDVHITQSMLLNHLESIYGMNKRRTSSNSKLHNLGKHNGGKKRLLTHS